MCLNTAFLLSPLARHYPRLPHIAIYRGLCVQFNQSRTTYLSICGLERVKQPTKDAERKYASMEFSEVYHFILYFRWNEKHS